MLYKTYYDSFLGKIILESDGKSLSVLKLECHRFYSEFIKQEMIKFDDLEVFNKTKNWLDKYFAGKKPAISELSLSPIGSEFRQVVWNILCEIPYGEVITYGDVAKKMAIKMNKKSMSSQAVGGAVGHNPISIIIPCHRVVGTKGNLTGYGGGINNKIKLLKLEKVDTEKFYIPTTGNAL